MWIVVVCATQRWSQEQELIIVLENGVVWKSNEGVDGEEDIVGKGEAPGGWSDVRYRNLYLSGIEESLRQLLFRRGAEGLCAASRGERRLTSDGLVSTLRGYTYGATSPRVTVGVCVAE